MRRGLVAPAFIAALLAAGLASAAVALIAVRQSYYGVFPAAGTSAALADAVLRGLAPGHEDGRSFMRTYYLPPFPLLIAMAHRMGLGWLQALRAGSLLSGLCLVVSAGWAAHALGAGRRGAALAMALVMATFAFKASLLDGRADLLAAAFSLAALAAWSRDPDARGWATPALAAASVLTKATSLSIPLALAWWTLRRREPRALARFGARFALCALAEALLTLPAHGPGWYATALRALVEHASGRSHPLRGPAELVRYLGVHAEFALFTAFALALLASRRMRGNPAVAYAGASLVIAGYAMTSYYSGPNHLVEIAAVAATLAAVWAAPRLSRRSLLPAAALAIAVAGASWRDLAPVLRHARAPGNLRLGVIEAVRAEPGETLAEDPLISLAAGRRPAVSDMDALRALALMDDPRATKIIDQLARRHFALVVLNGDLEANASWYRTIRFTDLSIAPIQSGYRKDGIVDDYHLYRPLADSSRGTARVADPGRAP